MGMSGRSAWMGAIGTAVLVLAGACNGSGQSPGAAGQSTGTGPAIRAVSVTGRGALADGTAVSSTKIQFQLILDGSNLFQAGIDGCLPTPSHVAGTVIQKGSSGPQGQYALDIPVGSIRAAVVRQCAIRELRASQVIKLIMRATILADATTCPAYCAAADDPSAACVDDCTQGNRTIEAVQATTPEKLARLLANPPGGVVEWNAPLVFNKLGPALGSGSMPDLKVDGDAARTSAHLAQETFSASSCEVAEKCVRAPGPRTVLRFDGTIQNVGDADLVIGTPATSTLFAKSTCHNVELLKDIMSYELVDPMTGEIVKVGGQEIVGRKQGFCMMDITQINATAPQGHYDCGDQGITRGWADVYDSALDCQFLDVTDVPPGDYVLRLAVDPDGQFKESDSSNNSVEVPVTLK